MRNVGNVNSNFEVSVGQLSAVQSIVDVRAPGRVDGADVEMATIDATHFVLKLFKMIIEIKLIQSELFVAD
jgi:hypothetical protein